MKKGYNIKDCESGDEIHKETLKAVSKFLGLKYGSIAYHFNKRNHKPPSTQMTFRSREDNKYYLVQKIV